MKRFEVRARLGSYGSVTLRIEANDPVDALSQAYRELSDGSHAVIWLDCRELRS